MTELVSVEDPYRKTALTKVTRVKGQEVRLEKSIYHARSTRYGHPMVHDRGHLVVDGHKLKIVKVLWRNGELAHRVTGPRPTVGAKTLCHLDWPRRLRAMQAHAALHLVEHAVAAEQRGGVEHSRVTGGGNARATLHLPDPSPSGVAKVLARVNALVAENVPVTQAWYPRDVAAKRVTPAGVALEDAAPGEPVVRMIDLGDVARHACDAPIVKRTGEVGRVVAPQVRQIGGGRVEVQFRVLEEGA